MYQIINQSTNLPVGPELTHTEMVKECKVRTTTPGMNQPSYYVLNLETRETEGNLQFWLMVQ